MSNIYYSSSWSNKYPYKSCENEEVWKNSDSMTLWACPEYTPQKAGPDTIHLLAKTDTV